MICRKLFFALAILWFPPFAWTAERCSDAEQKACQQAAESVEAAFKARLAKASKGQRVYILTARQEFRSKGSRNISDWRSLAAFLRGEPLNWSGRESPLEPMFFIRALGKNNYSYDLAFLRFKKPKLIGEIAFNEFVSERFLKGASGLPVESEEDAPIHPDAYIPPKDRAVAPKEYDFDDRGVYRRMEIKFLSGRFISVRSEMSIYRLAGVGSSYSYELAKNLDLLTGHDIAFDDILDEQARTKAINFCRRAPETHEAAKDLAGNVQSGQGTVRTWWVTGEAIYITFTDIPLTRFGYPVCEIPLTRAREWGAKLTFLD